MLLAGGGIKGSKEAGGGTEGSKVSSGTFASVSKDRGSNEVEGTVDSIWLVITSGESTGEGSRATERPGEAAFMLRCNRSRKGDSHVYQYHGGSSKDKGSVVEKPWAQILPRGLSQNTRAGRELLGDASTDGSQDRF